ncbi:MAG TPA: hypothetical protein DET40_22665 [Lentisphaeria bacterium]|nr:MAG: hypothetical protein A2X45_17390 [Lentisphaerae bacterium GWF2_50_93]HCE46358.1 hypothetical protein [Lentisphaeria bacterium]
METISFRRRKLPHWRVARSSYFVTIRLHGTIPAKVVYELKDKLEEFKSGKPADLLEYQRWQFRKIESILDNCSNNKDFLAVPDVAKMVLSEIDDMENEFAWRIPATALMPNHVHLLCVGESAIISLDKFFKRFKGRTAVKANRILGREGNPFWAEEIFDHWCRNSQKEESVKRYILNNPVKAGLVSKADDWPWIRIK